MTTPTPSRPSIEMRSPSDLVPYSNNARTHSKKQVAQIARSIERFGFTNPALVDDEDGIIAGHGRVAAAQQLGLPEIPTIRLSHLSEADRRAYILADNKLAENAGWDEELLAIELQGLIDLDFEMGDIGFSTTEIDIILDGVLEKGAAEADERLDAVPALPDGLYWTDQPLHGAVISGFWVTTGSYAATRVRQMM